MVGVADFFDDGFGGKDAKAFFDVKFNFKVVKVFFIKMSFVKALSATITFVPF